MTKERETWIEVEIRCGDGSKCFMARGLSPDELVQINDVARDAKWEKLGTGNDAAIWAEVLAHGLQELSSYFAYDSAPESASECVASLDAVRHYLRQAG